MEGAGSMCSQPPLIDAGPNATSLPYANECLQYTYLVWAPALFFWLLAPIFYLQNWRARKDDSLARPTPYSYALWVKMAIPLILCVDSVSLFFVYALDDASNEPLMFMYPLVRAVTMLAVFFCIRWARESGLITSGVIHLTFLVHAVCALPEAYDWLGPHAASHRSIKADSNASTLLLMTFAIWFVGLCAECALFCFADKRSEEERLKSQLSPELHSSFVNRMLLWWFNPLPMLGARKNLTVDDLFELNYHSTYHHLVPLWERYWTPTIERYNERKKALLAEGTTSKLLDKANGHGAANGAKKSRAQAKDAGARIEPPSIAYNCLKMFKYELIATTGLKAMSDVLQFANPFLLKELIGFVSDPNAKLWQGVCYALLMFIASEVRCFLINYHFYLLSPVGIKIQTALTCAVYKKALRLSNSARRDRTVGEIVNLMAIDVERLQQIVHQINQYWSSPFQVALALVFLFNTLGISALPGVVIMVIFVPLSVFSSLFTRRWQNEQMKWKDERTKMVNEVLNGIKVVKLYGWEVPMKEAIERIRKLELRTIFKTGIVKASVDVFNFACPFLVAMGSFTTFSLIDPSNRLTPAIAFVSLTLFNMIRSPLTMVGMLINNTVAVMVSNKRVKEFLVADEIDPNTVDFTTDTVSPDAIVVKSADFSWGSPTGDGADGDGDGDGDGHNPAFAPTLQDIQLQVPRGSTLAVVGRVGSGKSSLLSALLGEMERHRGYAGVRGQLAYVPQSPWIQNMSLRENITFGLAYDAQLYDQVVEMCALRSDIDALPYGDATEIGEKGINLSGGQKARVSLARAVYSNLDIYLLDDPLSAVDSHVGKWIFDKVIGPEGILRNKTRVLVTHGVSFLKHMDRLVVMDDGRIAESGTYAQLLASNGKFAKLIEDGKMEEEEDGGGEAKEAATRSQSLHSQGGEGVDDYEELADAVAIDDGAEMEMTPMSYDRQISTVSTMANRSAMLRRQESLARKQPPAHPLHAGTFPHSNYPASLLHSAAAANGLSASKEMFQQNKLIQREHVETGRVKTIVYARYIKAATYLFSGLFFSLFCGFQALQVGRSVWLSKWADDNERMEHDAGYEPTSLGVRLGVYAIFGVAEAVAFFTALMALLLGGLAASRNLHGPMLERILHAPMEFYDTTPLGRILNRFGKDVDVIDGQLPLNFRYFLWCAAQVSATIIIITATTPIFAVVILPLTGLYLFALKFYVPTSRQLKRLESSNRSPVYSHFGESLQGASTIRAFGKSDEFAHEIGRRVDRVLRIRYLNLVSNRWLSVRLEFVGNCVVLFSALFAALSNEWGLVTSAGLVGLSVSYALNITDSLSFAVRMISELESYIVSVERVKEYSEIKTEAPWVVEGKRPPKGWPSAGVLHFQDYSTRYREGLELVVKGINVEIGAAENVGIVGRTGAGKSSLTLALFRMIEPVEGRILIDGLDITTIGLHDLRQSLTIIPQEPVLFSGTLRFNLDPFNKYSDPEIWKVLELAHLKGFAGALPEGLSHALSEGGNNISIGQRQLVCLARALLRRSKILVLDEATAAVDIATDALIQETIRQEFSQSTVFTIAHRLNTIIDYNRVLVLDKGEVREFDSPQTLMADRASMFAKMAVDARIKSGALE